MPRHRPWAALPALALSGAMVLGACSGDEGSAEELCAAVRDDLTVEIDYVQALLEGIEGLDGRDSAETVAVVQQITSEHPDVDDAAASLAAFAAESCGSAG
jgi:hypothetical protein